MTTAPFNFKGTTVRCGGIVGTIGAQDTRNDTTWYAVDFTLNSKPMRIWRQPKALDIIAGVVKVAPVVTPDKPDLARIDSGVVDSTLNPENGVLSPQKGEISNDPTAEIKRDSEPTYILVREKVNLSAPAGDWLLLERTTFDGLRVGDTIVYVSEVVDFRTSKPLPPNTKREPVRTIGDYKMIGDSKRKHINGGVPLADAPVWRLAILPVLTDADYGVIAA